MIFFCNFSTIIYIHGMLQGFVYVLFCVKTRECLEVCEISSCSEYCHSRFHHQLPKTKVAVDALTFCVSYCILVVRLL